MGKRKRAPSKSQSSSQVSKKRRRAKSPVESEYSEAAPHEYWLESVEIVTPPLKSKVRHDKALIFPMGYDRSPLPRCEGPKMKPFSDGDVAVEFIRELGGNAMHSNVFEIKIDGKPYALKLFKTFTEDFYPQSENWSKIWDDPPDSRTASYYFRPFFRECRAYARIWERGLQDRYWKCYGYLKLPANCREQLYDITGLPSFYWQVRPDDFGRTDKPTDTHPHQLHWSIYALVKELAPSSAKPFVLRKRNVRRMKTDLRLLHKAGIVNDDIADRNYIAGRMIDFSLSYTLPHIYFDKPRNTDRNDDLGPSFENLVAEDWYTLRYAIAKSGVKTKAVAFILSGDYVSRNTRSWHAALSKRNQHQPLYELGVNEPQSRYRSHETFIESYVSELEDDKGPDYRSRSRSSSYSVSTVPSKENEDLAT